MVMYPHVEHTVIDNNGKITTTPRFTPATHPEDVGQPPGPEHRIPGEYQIRSAPSRWRPTARPGRRLDAHTGMGWDHELRFQRPGSPLSVNRASLPCRTRKWQHAAGLALNPTLGVTTVPDGPVLGPTPAHHFLRR